ncbi:MAG: UTP--glucose-1-phosphate uridylyltransferase [Planctomycetia bacterium]|nr:UTP--glucose-1-phosphate uridylyltransferase [Planctomycetia bacterium]
MTQPTDLYALVAPFGQEQLLTFWQELDATRQVRLREEILATDFDQIARLFRHRNDPPAAAALASRAKEPTAFRLSDQRERVTPVKPGDYSGWSITPAEAIAAGEAALRAGKVAVAVVAGGQGTRLDFPHAKGIFPIGPVSNVSLFQIHIERILAMGRRYGVRIPFCVQTSPATHEETLAYFRDNHNFGLAEDDVFIFCQGTIPSVDGDTGKILLAEKDVIARSPDGHGGFLAAINMPLPQSALASVRENGILAELQNRGIDELFYFQVDNPVIDIASPEFLGYHLLAASEFSSQVVRKEHPLDRVGNMVMVDGSLHVIEYSDLPEEAANRRKPDGSLEIWAGSIAVHVMNVPFLRAKANLAGSLPYHVAKKKVPHIVLDPAEKTDDGATLFGTKVKPDKPNAIKFEKFIFDLLPQAKNPIVVEVDTQTCFAPLKNHPNQPTDNPQTVQAGLANLYRLWLAELGITVADGVTVEISPLFANSAVELKERLAGSELVPPDRVIRQSVYWS